MAIIITGGSGLLGRVLTKDLAATGEKIYILSRAPAGVKPVDGAELVKWDGKTPAGWQELVEQASVIINLAGDNIGGGLWTAEKKKKIVESRVQAGVAVAAAVQAATRRPSLVIQASGIGYYGESLETEFDENFQSGSSWQAKTCVLWEDSTRPVENLGIRRVIVRTAPVLDGSSGILPRFMLPFKFFIGGPLGSGKQWVSWIHIRDFSRAIQSLMQNQQAYGPYNLTAPQPERYSRFGRILAKAMKRPYWAPAPGFVLRLALGEMSTLVLDGQRVVPKRLLALGFQFDFPDLASALKDLL